MSVATLRYEPLPADLAAPPAAPHQRGDGALDIAFALRDGATMLSRLYQRTPCRALLPRPPAGEPPLAVLITTSGGLAGGDRLSLAARAEEGAAVTITSQAAEKVYRSLGPDARVEARLAVAAGARLEWLPQETILFDGARLERHISAELAADARLLACESLVLGRRARGETFVRGRVRETWRILRDGRLVWVDRFGLEGDGPHRARFGLGTAGALATALYAGPDAADLLPEARRLAEAEGGGATLVNGLLVARLLGAQPSRLRQGLARLVGGLRRAAFGILSGPPALWAV